VRRRARRLRAQRFHDAEIGEQRRVDPAGDLAHGFKYRLVLDLLRADDVPQRALLAVRRTAT